MTISFEMIQKIDTWIREYVKGCKLIGISNDGELFLEYQDPEEHLEDLVAEKIKDLFPEIVNKVLSVSKPSIQQLEQTINELNKIMAGEEKPRTPLLQIGDF